MKDLKLYYTTEEVADHFEVAPSKIRYYEAEFNLKIKTVGKNKAYSKKDIRKLGKIIALVKEDNYTLQGAKEQLKRRKDEQNRNEEVISRLKNLREVLVRLRGKE
ncbi:MerR family transcriptional regulator [Jiulongibacter sp. NS-SX5]|uniref:MerR family transcriptional regulator n=1 Tax=Jiulongibacter sp. NS-SX5 TaxID=3463854 RepID=UPI004059DE6E